MRDETVARSYAETLLELAERHEGPEVFAEGMELVRASLESDPRFRLLLETPRVDLSEKREVLRRVFGESIPRPLLNFLLVTLDKHRQRLLLPIAREFSLLVDERLGRIHVDVTLAREPNEDEIAAIADRLGTLVGGTAIPRVKVDPALLGGIVVQSGDTIWDGSLRARLGHMRRRLLNAGLPARS